MLKTIYKMQKYETKKITISGKQFRAIIADSLAKRMIGLMFRERLAERDCMLFIFPNAANHGIWMHNMQFPIDVMWLDKRLRVISTKENLQPCGSFWKCKTYYPEKDAKYIIETSAGLIRKCKIKSNPKVSVQ